ncbi:hypothetical protein [Massilia sp. Bi118]|uniref:hypothetical protein n=1 Tax=Massilia sp. Bi118 TaxID=2822346 RepID=UPI001E29952B|nr:hypothetical protein [Massilia sp. Bi118]
MELPPRQALIQLMLQLQRNGLALSQAYAARQTALELEKVVTVERLSSMEGVATSLAVIAALEALVEEHRKLVRQWLVEATRQLVPVLEEHPEDQRKDISDGLMAALQAQMQHQHLSLQARGEWIDAARSIFRLAQRARELDPRVERSLFANEDDFEEAERQGERMDAASAAEHRLQEELAARMRARLEQFQPR